MPNVGAATAAATAPGGEGAATAAATAPGGEGAAAAAAHVPYAKKKGLKSISMEEVAKHRSEDDCWLVLGGIVYDVTAFLEKHPGGPQVMADLGGQDATVEFEDIGHSLSAKTEASEYEIGVVEGQEETAVGTSKPLPHVASSKSRSDGGVGFLPYLIVVAVAAAAYFLLQQGQPGA